ncbi:MAG: dephospho-CoA kinase, partial [Gammaproteobacteria bacterium]|nr:dephospho-CoA kinase [Gammaproteobacteria bacterium]
SGKSTVAALFAALGVPVIDLDEVAREVVAPGTALLERVFARFGAGLRQADGSLDRRALRERILRDAAARAELESLLHPAILARAAERSAAAGGPYQLVVIPLLAETGAARQYDRVLVVDCAEPQQRARLAQRDGATAGMIDAALAAQATRAARLALADEVIHNDAEPAGLAAQVQNLHRRYLELAAARAPSARGSAQAQ